MSYAHPVIKITGKSNGTKVLLVPEILRFKENPWQRQYLENDFCVCRIQFLPGKKWDLFSTQKVYEESLSSIEEEIRNLDQSLIVLAIGSGSILALNLLPKLYERVQEVFLFDPPYYDFWDGIGNRLAWILRNSIHFTEANRISFLESLYAESLRRLNLFQVRYPIPIRVLLGPKYPSTSQSYQYLNNLSSDAQITRFSSDLFTEEGIFPPARKIILDRLKSSGKKRFV